MLVQYCAKKRHQPDCVSSWNHSRSNSPQKLDVKIRPGKSSVARQPATSGVVAAALKWPLRRSKKFTADKKCSENPQFYRLPEITDASGRETFSWPDKNSLRIYTNSQPFFHWLSLSMSMTPNRIGYNFYEYTVHNCTMRKFH